MSDSRKRTAVYQGQTRVTGLWTRTTAEGRVVFELQSRIDGKPTRTVLEAATKTDAIIEARGYRTDLERGLVAPGDRSITIAGLARSFVDHERGILGKRAARTVDLYEQRLTDYVLPLLGPRTKACDVSIVHVRKLIDRLTARGLAGSTVRGVITASAAMFRHAVRDGVLPRNPCRDLDRDDLPSAKRGSEPRYLDVEQVNCLLDQLSKEMRPVAAALFYGALRISEALALTWKDVGPSTLDVPGTKTEGSRSTILLVPALARELAAHRERKLQQGIHMVGRDARVFSTRSGKPVSRRNALRAVHQAGRKAGLVRDGQEPVGLHDLRHSLAANAFALGLSDLEVANLLRHSSPAVTNTVYAGITDKGRAAIGDKLAAGGFGQ